MRITETKLRAIIRQTISEARTKKINLARVLAKSRITSPYAVSRAMPDLSVRGSGGLEVVANLPFSGKYKKDKSIDGPEIYQKIAASVRSGDLSFKIDNQKVCTFELDGMEMMFTFGMKQKSTMTQCKEQAESLRSVYNVPEEDLGSELERMGWTKREVRKALK